MFPTLQGVVSSLKLWARNKLPSFEHASVRYLVTATRKVTDATRKSQLENTATGYLSVRGGLAYKMTMQNPLVMSCILRDLGEVVTILFLLPEPLVLHP